MIIAHLSDIHIRRTKRHDEYRDVLKNLVNNVESFDVDRIVIAGDLLHNKTDLSPEAVSLTSLYLDELSNIAPVDLILGNHDCIINNNRMDSLSPVVSLLQEKGKPINFFTESGLVEVDDKLVYGIFAQQDNEDLWPIDFEKESGKFYVALYHGAINGSITNITYRLESDTNSSIFRNYDYGMLGDIHSRQPIVLDDEGKVKVAYSGSLIQQNFGEDIEKGFLLWDLEKHKCSFVQVANDYGFKTFRLDKDAINNIDNLNFDLPKKAYVRILISSNDFSVTTQKHVESIIKRKYKPEKVWCEVDVQSPIEDLSLSGRPENVTDLKVQQDLIVQYFAKRPTISEQEVKEVLEIHKDFYNTHLTEEYDTYRGRSWKIHKVIFENVFSYGTNNIINFDKLRGLTGVFSPNASGKSSILYTILQGFFNCSNRTGGRNVADVIHKNKNEGYIEIDFSIDNKNYCIERTFKRNKRNPNRASNKVSLYRVDESGEKINISGQANVRETENVIRTMLGSYEEHTMTTFSQQFDVTRWIDHGQTNRKELLSRFLGLNVIDDLQKAIKDETSETKTLLKEYQNQDFPSMLSQFNTKREEIVETIKTLNKKGDELEDELTGLRKKQIDLSSSLMPITENLRSIGEIDSSIKNSIVNIDKIKEEETSNINQLSEINNRIIEIENKIKDFDGIDNLIKEYNEKKKSKIELNTEIKIREQSLKSKTNQTKILKNHSWFESNDLCKKCSFLTEAFKAKVEIEEEAKSLELLKNDYLSVNSWIKDKGDVERQQKDYESIKREKDSKKISIEKISAILDRIKLQGELEESKLSSYNDEKEAYKLNEQSILENNRIKDEISLVNQTIAEFEGSISENNESLSRNNTLLGQINQKITDLGGNIEILKEIERKYNLHTYLMDAFGKDGIPLLIMNRAIPLINSEIRKILANVSNFELYLEIDTELHDLIIFIDDGTSKRRVELGSGMEKTLAALSIRSALSNISLLPTCNLFVIDEGFGTLDSEHINHMNQLLGYLKTRFDNVLIISHIESMQDITNNVINVTKNDNGYSNIKII